MVCTYFRQTTYCIVKTSPYCPKTKNGTAAQRETCWRALTNNCSCLSKHPVLKVSTPSIPVLKSLVVLLPLQRLLSCSGRPARTLWCLKAGLVKMKWLWVNGTAFSCHQVHFVLCSPNSKKNTNTTKPLLQFELIGCIQQKHTTQLVLWWLACPNPLDTNWFNVRMIETFKVETYQRSKQSFQIISLSCVDSSQIAKISCLLIYCSTRSETRQTIHCTMQRCGYYIWTRNHSARHKGRPINTTSVTLGLAEWNLHTSQLL